MNLVNYWKVLANPSYKNAKWHFYSNGWFAAEMQKEILLFNHLGELFSSFSKGTDICVKADGLIAVGSMAVGKWQFYDKESHFITEVQKNAEPLNCGYYAEHLPSGETHLVSLRDSAKRFNLGHNVLAIRDSAQGRLAYAQKVRRQTYWHLCQIKDDMLTTNDLLYGALNVDILTDGSYILYSKNDSVRVFNAHGHRVFSCNHRKTNFCLVGERQFFAYNDKAYRGVYDTRDGRLLLPNDNIQIYWENGAYFSPSVGLVFAGFNGLLGSKLIYQCRRFTEELASLRFRDQTFVVDTAQPLVDLRRQLCNILLSFQSKERDYAHYVAEFLLMII